MEILLIRHGKPRFSNNPTVSARGYLNWIRKYNFSDIVGDNIPSDKIDLSNFKVISSNLKRAIHSCQIYSQQQPEMISKLFREMEVPRYKLPIKLKAWNWVYISRILWLLGFKGSFESFCEAKSRAVDAAELLTELAKLNNNVALFGHGLLNRYIGKELIKRGWTMNAKNNGFWGITKLTVNKSNIEP